MTEGQDFRVERSSGAEALPNRMEQREDERAHVVRNVQASPRRLNRLNK